MVSRIFSGKTGRGCLTRVTGNSLRLSCSLEFTDCLRESEEGRVRPHRRARPSSDVEERHVTQRKELEE